MQRPTEKKKNLTQIFFSLAKYLIFFFHLQLKNFKKSIKKHNLFTFSTITLFEKLKNIRTICFNTSIRPEYKFVTSISNNYRQNFLCQKSIIKNLLKYFP